MGPEGARAMPDDLYHTDILAWSRAQAERLRRVAAGERVNDLDWAHVIEEVADVGRSELNAVVSNLVNAITHALKLVAWPEHQAADHWRGEFLAFLGNARRRFEPGMQQHIDPAEIYADARQQVMDIGSMGGQPPRPLPAMVAFTAAELRDKRFGASEVLARIRAAQEALP
jgi:hypothetical protein